MDPQTGRLAKMLPQGLSDMAGMSLALPTRTTCRCWRGRSKFSKTFNQYSQKFPELAEQLSQMQHHNLPAGWDKNLPAFPADAKGIATRESSGKVLNALAQKIPWMIGGSADLATSNKTTLK